MVGGFHDCFNHGAQKLKERCDADSDPEKNVDTVENLRRTVARERQKMLENRHREIVTGEAHNTALFRSFYKSSGNQNSGNASQRRTDRQRN